MQTITSTKGDIQIPDEGDWIDREPVKCMMAADGAPIWLTRIPIADEDDHEKTTGVEYWVDEGLQVPELIHRSVHVTLKPQAGGSSSVGTF